MLSLQLTRRSHFSRLLGINGLKARLPGENVLQELAGNNSRYLILPKRPPYLLDNLMVFITYRIMHILSFAARCFFEGLPKMAFFIRKI